MSLLTFAKGLTVGLLALHGIAHLVGFRTTFWPTPAASRRAGLLGHRFFGLLWLSLALSYVLGAGLWLLQVPAWAPLTLTVTAISAGLCIACWPEARIGLFIDVLLFAAIPAASRSGGAHLASSFERELAGAQLPAHSASTLVTADSLRALPPTVQRYLTFMSVVGKPRDWSLRARFVARFRREPGPWLRCEALQYDSRLGISRVFYMQLALGNALPVTVRDTYLHGHGHMQAKVFDLLPVAEGTGYELDVGELVTYLNDAVLMAPSLLLGPETTWHEATSNAFDVSLRDGALHVSARVWIDDRGAPLDFSTTDRFFDAPDGKRRRTEWRTPVSGWQSAHGRMLPLRAQAVWQLPTGPFVYADFSVDPAQISFNVAP